MTVFVVDPGAGGVAGHFVQLDRVIAMGACTLGHACRIALPHRTDAAVLAAISGAEPVFDTPLSILDQALAGWTPGLPPPGAERFAARLGQFLATHGSGDIVVCHTLNVVHLHGFALWAARAAAPGVALRLVLRLEPDDAVRPERHAAAAACCREGFDALRATTAATTLFADSEGLSAWYATLSGMPVAVLPLAVDFPDAAMLAGLPGPPDGSVVLSFLGGPRPEKGIRHLGRAIRPVCQRFPEIRFRIHAAGSDLRLNRAGGASALPVETIADAVDRDGFFALIAASSLVLVPYDPAVYRHRTSHILAEALGSGRPVVAVDGGWLGREIRAFGGLGAVLAGDYTAEAIVEAIADFMERRERLTAEAVANAAAWRRRHNMTAVVSALLG
jgi:glycosyltransferase involved in cell wall biosynthesis